MPEANVSNTTEVRHTPGPWEVRHYTNYVGYAVSAKDRGCIAERWYDFPQAEPYKSEIGANARLIAAAPDLLEACRAFVASCDRNLRNAGKEGYWHDDAYNVCKAAIAKAEK